MKQLANLIKEFKKGDFGPINILVGEDTYLINQYLGEIETPKVVSYDWPSLVRSANQKSLFEQYRHTKVFLLYDNEAVLSESLESVLARLNGHKLILVYTSLDKRKKLAKEASGFITEIGKLSFEALTSYIMNELQVGISEQLANDIIAVTNGDLSRVDLEIDKLKRLDKIDKEVVSDVVGLPIDDRIFNLMNHLMRGEVKPALRIYHDLLELKEAHVKMLSILATKVEQSYLVKSYEGKSSNEISKLTGMSVYVVNSIINESNGYRTEEELLDFLYKCSRLEVEIKTGLVDAKLGFENLMLKLLA